MDTEQSAIGMSNSYPTDQVYSKNCSPTLSFVFLLSETVLNITVICIAIY